MFPKRLFFLFLMLFSLLSTAETAAAAQIESGSTYCFSAADFDSEETITGICITDLPQNQGNHGPNAENQRRQQPSQGQFPPQPTHTQGGKISQPRVCLANGEAVDQPGADDPGQQQSVPQPGVPPQQRLEHIVPDPDPQSQEAPQ